MKKGWTILVLCALLLTTVAMLGSCHGGKTPDSTTDSGGGSNSTSATDEWGRPMLHSPLDESLFYSGETMTVISRDTWNSAAQFEPNDLDSDIMYSAVQKRNEMIYQRLGVEIRNIPVAGGDYNAQLNQRIRTQVSGGNCEFDMIANFAYYGSALAMEGYYYDLNRLQNIYTDQAWWNQDYIEQSVIGNKMYMAVNDACLVSLRYTFVTFFQKPLVNAWLNGVNLYSVVDSNEWTVEYFDRLVKDVYSDVNGSDRDEKDLYGLVTSSSAQNIDSFFAGMGLKTCTLNDVGTPELSLNNDLTLSGFELISDLYFNNNGVFVTGSGNDDYRKATEIFSENRSLFSVGQLDNGSTFLNSMAAGSFGILPMPKMDESDSYSTTAQDAYDFLALPSTLPNQRLEMAGAVMEYMAYASYLTVKPSYFETVTKLRYSTEADDARMFDIISENIYFDFGMIYSSSIMGVGTHLGHFWRSLFQNQTTGFITEYRKSESAYEKQLGIVIDMLME